MPLSDVTTPPQLIRITGHPYLSVATLRKSFGATVAVNDVTLALDKGEVVGLVGENGAGKSTLISLLTGAATPDGGEITVGGEVHRALTPGSARSLGLRAIRQEPVLVPTLRVWENLVLGREPRRRGLLDSRAARRIARDWLDRVGAAVPVDAPVDRLSPAQRQLVEIARAAGPGAALLFFDEPTAALGPAETANLFGLIRQLADAGTGVAYVSHRLEEVFAVCDRVVVMRDGAVVEARPTVEFDEASLVAVMAGRALAADLSRRAGRPVPLTTVAVRATGISLGSRLRGIDLTVHRGEIHAIAGMVGSGRSTLVEILAGAVRAGSGAMVLGDRPYLPSSSREALDAGVVLVPEDRVRDGIFPDLSQAENTVLASIGSISRHGLVATKAEREAAAPYLAQVGVRPSRPGMRVGLLSGGNQQKVVLARALFTRPKVLLLDEPTRGIDVHAKAEIHDLIRSQAARGTAVIVVSSDLREIVSLADSVTVLARGRVTARLVAPFDGDEIVAAATGHAA